MYCNATKCNVLRYNMQPLTWQVLIILMMFVLCNSKVSKYIIIHEDRKLFP